LMATIPGDGVDKGNTLRRSLVPVYLIFWHPIETHLTLLKFV
jgi:hypothetical protein